MKLPATLTPVTVAELASAFRAAGLPEAAIPLALSHWATETGWGASMHAYCLGNAKATDGWCATQGNDWQFYPCDEIINGKTITCGPAQVAAEDPMCRFRAFPSLAAGAADYLAMMRGNFPRSYTVMESGDAAAFAHALKSERYYTADEAQYTKTLVGVLAMVRDRLAAPAAGPSAHPDHDVTPHPAATTFPLFVFSLRPGEAVGDRRARCWEEALAGGPMGHALRGLWYESFVDASTPAGYMGVQPCASIASWATSCLITQEAVDNHCGRAPKRPPRNGEGFFTVYGQPHVKAGGAELPARGDVIYWASNGTNGHVECLLGIDADGTWRTAGGGGGPDGTGCSLRTHLHGKDAYGRPLVGWWKADRLPLPASPTLPDPPPTRPDLHDLIASADVDSHDAVTQPAVPRTVPRAVATPAAPAPKSPVPWSAYLLRVAAAVSGAVAMLLGAARAHPVVAACVVATALALVLGAVEWARERQRVRSEEAAVNAKRFLQLSDLFNRRTEREHHIMSTFADLVAQVASTVAGEQSTDAAISGIVARYEALLANGGTLDQISALTASLKASQASLVAAVATIPADPAPAPAPSPAPAPAGGASSGGGVTPPATA